jgi:uncharacterized membrane protein YidH (DUF202 family)
MPATHSRPTSVSAGFAVFGIGLLFLLATLLPYFFGSDNRPLWLNLGCLLVPVGVAIAVAGAIRAGRAEQRAALRQAEQGVRKPAAEDFSER